MTLATLYYSCIRVSSKHEFNFKKVKDKSSINKYILYIHTLYEWNFYLEVVQQLQLPLAPCLMTAHCELILQRTLNAQKHFDTMLPLDS